MKAIAVHFVMSEAQGGGLIRDQFPPNTTPAQARESAPLRWKTQLRMVHLLLNTSV